MGSREPAAAAIERSAVDAVRDAHQALDAAGVPRELAGAIRLSLVARIDWLDRRRFTPAMEGPFTVDDVLNGLPAFEGGTFWWTKR